MKENEMIHTGRVLIVEGKYDAARLSHLTDAMVLLTDGFGIYSDKKRQQLFKALAQKNGLILLTDSDAAGFRIRTYITNLVGEKNVVQAYVPAIHGKEKRKEQPGKEGLLGVAVSYTHLTLPGRTADHLYRPLRVGAFRQAGQRRAQGKASERAGPAAASFQKGAGGSAESTVYF